jgi:hypothetical protein
VYDQLAGVWSATTDEGLAAGFSIDWAVEARPTRDAVQRSAELERVADTPSFIVYRLRRTPDR